jgi:peroxiredoxin Q/BCP
MIEVGKQAPGFLLEDKNGVKVSLKDFKGKKVVLYFYPKDATSGASTCIKEACEFRDSFPKFKKADAVVIGISPDTVLMHKKFAKKFKLPFILLSDEQKKVLERYRVWKEKIMFGNKYMGVERTTFVIDEKGKVIKIFPKVRVKGHAEEVLKVLKII